MDRLQWASQVNADHQPMSAGVYLCCKVLSWVDVHDWRLRHQLSSLGPVSASTALAFSLACVMDILRVRKTAAQSRRGTKKIHHTL
eukprot:1140123-Pelagomonas_calceolata.AAC.2